MKKPTLKFIWNCKRSQIAKIVFDKDKKIGGLMLPDFKTYYTATVIKTISTCIIIYHWNRIESPKINPYICGQLIFKSAKTIQW